MKYSVTIERTLVSQTTIEVEAAEDEEAVDKAYDMAHTLDESLWDDYDDDMDVLECELIEEDT